MYYDMVYNVYSYGSKGNEVKAGIIKANTDLDDPKLASKFCDTFGIEVAGALEKQPFAQANNITNWLKSPIVCTIFCLDYVQTVKVKPVCKYTWAGCQWIAFQKKNSIAKLPTAPVNSVPFGVAPVGAAPVGAAPVIVKPSAVPGQLEKQDETKPIADAKPLPLTNSLNKTAAPQGSAQNTAAMPPPAAAAQPASNPTTKTVVSPPGIISKPAADATAEQNNNLPSKTTESSKAKPPTETKKKPETDEPIPNEQISADNQEPYGNNDQRMDDENDGKNEEETENEQGAHISFTKSFCLNANLLSTYLSIYLLLTIQLFSEEPADDSHEEDHEYKDVKDRNSNYMHSPSRVEFREDKESSFFPYFMFLMFVVVSLYVAYHNKSKILALLIEGRRSRAYSLRGGGGRRKQHSAEYRKLDSNLEEAIQSEGGHVLSTQIIYWHHFAYKPIVLKLLQMIHIEMHWMTNVADDGVRVLLTPVDFVFKE